MGFLSLAIGFWKWMPTVIALNEAQRALKGSHDELEAKVEERTNSLNATNEQLREGIAERKQAEESLRESMEELERFNRLSVGRELRMIELKEEVNALLRELGREEEYRVDSGDAEA